VIKFLLKALCATCCALSTALLWAAEINSVITVPLGIGYTDNSGLKPEGQTESDFFWRVSPGLSLQAKGSRWNGALSYAYQYEKHQKDDRGSGSQFLSARFDSEVIDNLFYLNADAAISQVRSNLSAPVGFDSQNSDDVLSWRVMPAINRQFANSSRGGAGLDVYGVKGSGGNTGSDGYGERIYATYSTGGMFDSARFDLSANDDRYYYDYPRANAIRDYTLNQSMSARATLLVSRKLTPFASYGYENVEDDTLRRQPSETFWNAGFFWIPSVRTRLDASFGKRFFGDTRNISFTHRARRTNWLLSYVQDLRTGESDVQNPFSVGMFNQLNAALAQQFPDAATRASVVRSVMDSMGLPPTSILVTRNYVDRNLTANVSYSTVKSVFMLNLYARDSDASEVSLPVPPSLTPQGLGDRLKQAGASVNWNYRLGTKVGLSTMVGFSRESYPDVDEEDDNFFTRLGADYQISRHLSARSELRRIQRGSTDPTREYIENSVLLSLIGSF
jgi:uncharacterized protein (PEP-CTERM system associated)